jgi:cytochrome b561
MIAWSALIGLVGALATWGAMRSLGARESNQRPHLHWSLGLAAPLPAWLIAFVGLLGASPTGRPEASLSASFILHLSSSVALIGIILSDWAVRRLRESGRAYRSVTYWLLGGAALVPAWGIALLGLIWTTP